MPALFRRRAPRPAPDAAAVDAVEDLAPADPPEASGRLLDGRYRLGEPIGEGGMATVHVAEDLLLHRTVAIKLFRSSAVERDALRSQEAEARVIASLNHYALATLFDAGVDGVDTADPRLYLVMEHIAGGDLRTRLRQGPLSVVEVAWLGFDLSEALDWVHQAGFLHRDIKPANVLLSTLRSAKPIVGKLADFGIAGLLGVADTSEYTAGTAHYISPEQVEGLDAVAASDTYALGLVLLEALTGRVEFPGGVERSALARLERDPLIPDDLPVKVQEVLRGMTALEPGDRMPLAEVALRLQSYLVDVLVEARDATEAREPDADPEAARLAALHRYEILDTASDEVFDAITRIAGQVLGAPIALVTLIDSDRVWFKSRLGWDEQEVGRDTAFCSTTDPGTGLPWSVPDALADARTRSNELVTTGPQVRSYAGAPLIDRDGHGLGALCVFDHEPRDFTPQQLDALADLAGLAMHEIEVRDLMRRALFDRS